MAKRNPNDATLRNVRAQKKQIEILKARLAAVSSRVKDLEAGQRFLSRRQNALETIERRRVN